MSSKVLIVEDERLIARDLAFQLTQLGYTVVAIADRADEAIAATQQHHPDLIVMDIQIKGEVNGIVTATHIRAEFDCPILFLTAHADNLTIQEAQAAQPFGYLVKPVDAQSLKAAIEVALTRAETERSLRSIPPVHYSYQAGGSLSADAPSYVVRQADRTLAEALQRGEFCYVFNSRQMGKSSLRVRMKAQLERQGDRCAAIDLTNIGSEQVTPEQWYKGIASELWRSFNLTSMTPFKAWWEEQAGLSPVQQLSRFMDDLLLEHCPTQRLFIFIDEIDSILSLKFPSDDFFALIRHCYNRRAEDARYNRLTFALFGVATPSDLIQDRTRTPFNIGHAIELNGFQPSEIDALVPGLATLSPQPEQLLQDILYWTEGQPFLTQKLCTLLLKQAESEQSNLLPSVLQPLLEQWETADEPEHLRTIRDRLLRNEAIAHQILGDYQTILQSGSIPIDDSTAQKELLLSGLVDKQSGQLRVRNRLYATVFDLNWVNKHLMQLRPYGSAIAQWSNTTTEPSQYLLRGQALHQAQTWAQGKTLSPADAQYLADSAAAEQRLADAQALTINRKMGELERDKFHLKWLLFGALSLVFLMAFLWFISLQRDMTQKKKHSALLPFVGSSHFIIQL
jgi:CheY-like chemotaxis protein